MSPILQYLFYAMGLAGALAIGKSNLKKQTIADQSALITTLQNENEIQAKQIERLEKRVKFLEDLLYGRTRVVDDGHPDGPRRERSRDGSTTSALEGDENV